MASLLPHEPVTKLRTAHETYQQRDRQGLVGVEGATVRTDCADDSTDKGHLCRGSGSVGVMVGSLGVK